MFLISCTQSYTPELKVSCIIDFPLDNSRYNIKIQAGKCDTIVHKEKTIYNITLYPVTGGHTIIFGNKFNDRNGYTSPRLIVFKDNAKYQKFSYNDIIGKDRTTIDTLSVYKIKIK